MQRATWLLAGSALWGCGLLIGGCGELPPSSGPALNVSAHAAGAGAKAAPTLASERDNIIRNALAKLSPEDRKLAEAQKVCPVSGKWLGLMDAPVKHRVREQDLFICCSGCQRELESDPDRYVTELDKIKSDPDKHLAEHAPKDKPPADAAAATGNADSEVEHIIKNALANLLPDDRKLAEAQRVCPVSAKRLILIDAPIKVRLKDQDLFICCSGCRRELESDADKYLAALDEIMADPDKYQTKEKPGEAARRGLAIAGDCP
jgi:hypothetical protein